MVKKTAAQICYVWDSSQVTQMVKDRSEFKTKSNPKQHHG